MSRGNRLSATLPDTHREEINKISAERGIDDADAEREVVRAGLAKLDRIQEDTDSASVFLEYARKSGMILGFTGLTTIGYGLFGTAAFRWIGFGLILAGFGLIASAEFAPEVDRYLNKRAQSGEEAA